MCCTRRQSSWAESRERDGMEGTLRWGPLASLVSSHPHPLPSSQEKHGRRNKHERRRSMGTQTDKIERIRTYVDVVRRRHQTLVIEPYHACPISGGQSCCYPDSPSSQGVDRLAIRDVERRHLPRPAELKLSTMEIIMHYTHEKN
jgi:hypothetical protein